MSKRFGKKRTPGCTCEFNFTCRECLRDAATGLPQGVRSAIEGIALGVLS